jgi:hypothetical protein
VSRSQPSFCLHRLSFPFALKYTSSICSNGHRLAQPHTTPRSGLGMDGEMSMLLTDSTRHI